MGKEDTYDDEVAELLVAGDRGRLAGDTLLQATVTSEYCEVKLSQTSDRIAGRETYRKCGCLRVQSPPC